MDSGGPGLSHPNDCLVYFLQGEEAVLIDAGAGASFQNIVKNIRQVGAEPEEIKAVVATHCHIDHIDHIGNLRPFRQELGAQVIAHELDARAIETGIGTGAEFYRVDYIPCEVDIKLRGEENMLECGSRKLHVTHIPGHTPGCIAVYLDMPEGRVLFGQDIHGPYVFKYSNVNRARMSLQRLIDLEADILCEGHFGIYRPAAEVRRYIEGYLSACATGDIDDQGI